MKQSEFELREQGWREFHAWERSQPPTDRPFAELLTWLARSLEEARSRGDLVEEPAEEKAARVTRLKEALGAVRTSA